MTANPLPRASPNLNSSNNPRSRSSSSTFQAQLDMLSTAVLVLRLPSQRTPNTLNKNLPDLLQRRWVIRVLTELPLRLHEGV
jgi:hypothetical protein